MTQLLHKNNMNMKISAAILFWAAIISSSNAFVVSTSNRVAAGKTQQRHLLLQSSNNVAHDVGTYATSFQWQLYTSSSAAAAADQEEELTPETIAEMIEVSFLQSCLQLSQGYIDVLKLFIVSVKSGYEANLSLDALHQLVVDCPVNSAGRDLMKEELELRREWMMVVYEMMKVLKKNDEVAQPTNCNDVDTTSQIRVGQVIDFMQQLQQVLQQEDEQSGGQQDVNVALTTQTIETAMEKLPELSQLVNSIDSPVEKAFLMNDVRVALLVFKVLDEERVCLEDSQGTTSRSVGKGGETIPRPPIKGT